MLQKKTRYRLWHRVKKHLTYEIICLQKRNISNIIV